MKKLIALLILAIAQLNAQDRITGKKWATRSEVIAQHGMAATSQPLATQVALDILKKGGNAVDAAIAASVVLSVVEPNATGIGGDCFAIIAMNGKKPISYNGSGIAPEKAKIDFFINNKINKIGLDSPHSVTIPGAVHAWSTIHNDHGNLEFEQLLLRRQMLGTVQRG